MHPPIFMRNLTCVASSRAQIRNRQLSNRGSPAPTQVVATTLAAPRTAVVALSSSSSACRPQGASQPKRIFSVEHTHNWQGRQQNAWDTSQMALFKNEPLVSQCKLLLNSQISTPQKLCGVHKRAIRLREQDAAILRILRRSAPYGWNSRQRQN